MNQNITEQEEKTLEKRIAIVLTIFAAVLAVNGLFGGKYGDDEMIAHQKHTQMYTWYQSKGQKKMLAESKEDMIDIFEKSGLLNKDHEEYLQSLKNETDKKIKKYEKEMAEIKKGSAKVGKENWTQEDAEGKLGNIVGAEDYEAEADKLGTAGDFFDYGDLALNLSLVIGAIALVLSNYHDKQKFLKITFVLGIAGSCLTAYALYCAI